jgi:hypothetical protein
LVVVVLAVVEREVEEEREMKEDEIKEERKISR